MSPARPGLRTPISDVAPSSARRRGPPGAWLAACGLVPQTFAWNTTRQPSHARTSLARIGVFVVTTAAEEYAERIRMARSTWAPLGSPVVFLSAEGNQELGVEALPGCADDEERGVCCKTLMGFRLAVSRFPDADWLVRVVDDTFVFVDNLANELRVFDSSQWVYVGTPSVTLLCHIAKFAGQCGELHGGGGAGIVLSRPLVHALLHRADIFIANCRHDDVFLGQFLRYVFGVHLHVLPGILQEPRFSTTTWDPAQEAPPCPSPLPPPVYSRVDDWGPLHPFAPIDVRRLALVHSDPALWLHLMALLAAAAREEDKQGVDCEASGLLAFAEAGGRRVVAPHFRGAETLGVCAFSACGLLASFAQAAAPARGAFIAM